MNVTLKIYTLILLFAVTGCTTFKPIPDLPGKVIRGKIIDGESGEVLLGQQISEFSNWTNSTMTTTSGEFELKFEGTLPIIVLHGSYEPLNVLINPDEYNIIEYDHLTVRKSNKFTSKQENFYKKRNDHQAEEYNLPFSIHY